MQKKGLPVDGPRFADVWTPSKRTRHRNCPSD